jgi:hypothetical protein
MQGLPDMFMKASEIQNHFGANSPLTCDVQENQATYRCEPVMLLKGKEKAVGREVRKNRRWGGAPAWHLSWYARDASRGDLKIGISEANTVGT